MATSVILLVFSMWHALTYVCDSHETKGIPGIDQYILGNKISRIEVKKFKAVRQKASRESEILSRTAI